MDQDKEVQMAHRLLRMISNHKGELIPLFYETYRRHFSIIQVPPVHDFDSSSCRIVKIDKQKAIDFIKRKYNFVSREERDSILGEFAEELQKNMKEIE